MMAGIVSATLLTRRLTVSRPDRTAAAGDFDLAPMQATAISGDRLCVVAPLFYEILYVFARIDSDIHSIADLRNRHVAVGPPGSGSRATAELVLESLQLTPEVVTRDVIDWEQL